MAIVDVMAALQAITVHSGLWTQFWLELKSIVSCDDWKSKNCCIWNNLFSFAVYLYAHFLLALHISLFYGIMGGSKCELGTEINLLNWNI